MKASVRISFRILGVTISMGLWTPVKIMAWLIGLALIGQGLGWLPR
ncbi:MAG: hypothetical protein HY868_16640 [Chloroflexi bacterium]|nr:hypothetical protein [Chloroflexota bacterium]